MRWEPGRQGGGYEKLRLFEFILGWFGFDCYLIRYAAGQGCDWHIDPLPGGKHFRLNVVLRIGGSMFLSVLSSRIFRLGERIIAFRPDVVAHKVKAGKGKRLVFSLGVGYFG